MTLQIEVRFRELTTLDRCDRCRAQAKLLVKTSTGAELLFCAHHGTENLPALEAGGYKMKWSNKDD